MVVFKVCWICMFLSYYMYLLFCLYLLCIHTCIDRDCAEPIAEDYKTVVCPFIDVIDYENFAYRAQDEGARGAFDWEFFYKRLPLLEEDLKHPAEPFK